MTETPKDSDISPGFRDSVSAPIIYFDTAATFGVLSGAVQIELVSRILVPTIDGNARAEFAVTGRLRCSPAAAEQLRDAIEKCMQMLKKVSQGEPQVQAGKLN